MVVGEELADDFQAVRDGPVRRPAGAGADIRVRGILEQGLGIGLFPRPKQNPLRLDPVFFPSHLDVRDAVQDEGFGGLAETHLLIKALRVFLGFDVDSWASMSMTFASKCSLAAAMPSSMIRFP